MAFGRFRRLFPIFALLAAILAVLPSFSQESGKTPPLQTIEKYREILETAEDSAEIAEAHYRIGLALEELGKETEATAEYLKIIVNYPQVGDVNRKAEARLARLYNGFSARLKGRHEEAEVTEREVGAALAFFDYIKARYEYHRNLGEYDKAIGMLKELCNMDSHNHSYLVDIGNTYLHGYNDADRAILHFKKAIEIAPHSPRAYIELGRAYEKKNDYTSAVNAYTKAAEVSPASRWSMYGLRRIDGIRFARAGRLLKDWYLLGPFDNSDEKGLERSYPPEEEIDLKATYAGKDGASVGWSRPFDYDASGYVDLNALIRPNDYVVAYALTYVLAPDEAEVQVRFGAEDGIKIWLNDVKIFSQAAAMSAEVDDNLIVAKLNKGWNKLLLKVSETWGSWGFYFRVTDLNGNPMESLIFDPVRDDKRARYIYGEMKRKKRFKLTRIATIYAVAVSVFLLGLYFLISNIYNKIKINRMKEDFISSVSHELKTPIAAVKMLTETLKRGKIKQDARRDQYYGMIIRESDRLTRFINKILNFSKLEKGGKVFYFEKANVADIAKEAVEVYSDEAQDEDLKLQFNAEKDPIFAEVDKDAILQVIFNLIDNAYKYSREEKVITVNVKEAPRESGSPDGEPPKDVRIEVIDRGLGIPKIQVEKIFDKFYRVDREIMKRTKGSGLGLAFVKNVIDAHGGRIGVESELGKGSKFIILLPVEKG